MNDSNDRMEDLPCRMREVIGTLREAKKFPAVHTYTCTLNSIRRFADHAGVPCLTGEIFTAGRLREYESYLLCKGLSRNTVSTYMRTLRAVYRRLMRFPARDGDDGDPFRNVYLRVESHTKRALTQTRMHALLRADYRALPPSLRTAWAYFTLMFLLRGMPFIDLAHLRKSDLKGSRIAYCRHKTGRVITVDVTPQALALIREFRNRDNASPYLFPILDGGLTDVADLYACYQHALRALNKHLTLLSRQLAAGVKLSSYTARHTWATLAYHRNVPVGIISEAMGHSSIRVTETYLKPFGQKRVDKANRQLIMAIWKLPD